MFQFFQPNAVYLFQSIISITIVIIIIIIVIIVSMSFISYEEVVGMQLKSIHSQFSFLFQTSKADRSVQIENVEFPF